MADNQSNQSNVNNRTNQGKQEKQQKKQSNEQLCDLRGMSRQKNATDVQGSYTGTPAQGQNPVQDVDDL